MYQGNKGLMDLNRAKAVYDGEGGEPPRDNSASFDKIDVCFRNHKKRLLDLIGSHNLIVGCVAWVTDFDILRALSQVAAVSLVVQKEDFLRPDLDAKVNTWKKDLRTSYAAIQGFERSWFPTIGGLSYCRGADHSWSDGVRCVGNYNEEKRPAFPRMHNKFLIFGEMNPEGTREVCGEGDPLYRFTKVWTGSFNLTKNAGHSLENAVIISDEGVAAAYYAEFAHIFSLSEPLDWEHVWCTPEYRFGT